MECDLALERNKVPLHTTYTEGKKLASKENVLNDSSDPLTLASPVARTINQGPPSVMLFLFFFFFKPS
jgi:hypothetical protein